MAKKLEVKCSYCKKKFEYYSSEFRPFCSEKCKLSDLGMWLTESYTVAAQTPPDEAQMEKDLLELEKKTQQD